MASDSSPRVEPTIDFSNQTDVALTLDSYIIWYGERTRTDQIPKTIEQSTSYSHQGYETGSVVGISYVFGDNNVKWIVAWRVVPGTINKVYTNIIDGTTAPDWNAIYDAVLTSSDTSDIDNYVGYQAHIEIATGSEEITGTFSQI